MFSKFIFFFVAVLFLGLSGCKKTPKDEYKRIKTALLKIQKKVENEPVSRKKAKDYLKQLDKLEEDIDELEVDTEASMMDVEKEKGLLQKGVNYLMLEDLKRQIKRLRTQLKEN
jgi:hypothetical protein